MEIKLDPRNYRKHDQKNKDLINKSLKECGAGRSIVIDNEDNIIAGNGIYEQAQKLGLKTKIIETDGSELVVVKRTDLATEDEKRKQLAIMDNSTSDTSTFDFEILQADFDTETLIDYGLPIDFKIEEPQEVVEDEVPETVDTRCKRGDIWKLGNHRLMCGDSTSIDDINKLMGNETANCYITDPPYNVDYSSKNNFLNKYDKGNSIQTSIKNDKKTSNDFYDFLFQVFSNVYSIINSGGVFYVFYPHIEYINFFNALNNSFLKVHQNLVWCKNNHVLGMNDYHYKHEPLFYGWKEGKHNWYNDRSQTTVLNFNKPLKNDLHPTMKPIDLLAYLLQNSSKKDDIVVDTFGGSGSTLIACEQLNRTCYMMELDEHYCDVIIQRWENLTGKKAERIENGTSL